MSRRMAATAVVLAVALGGAACDGGTLTRAGTTYTIATFEASIASSLVLEEPDTLQLSFFADPDESATDDELTLEVSLLTPEIQPFLDGQGRSFGGEDMRVQTWQVLQFGPPGCDAIQFADGDGSLRIETDEEAPDTPRRITIEGTVRRPPDSPCADEPEVSFDYSGPFSSAVVDDG